MRKIEYKKGHEQIRYIMVRKVRKRIRHLQTNNSCKRLTYFGLEEI